MRKGEDPSFTLHRTLILALQDHGVEISQLLEEADISLQAMEDFTYRIPYEQFERLFHDTIEKTGNPAFALHMGAVIRPEAFGLFGYTALSCSTYGECLQTMVRYKKLIDFEIVHLSKQGSTHFVQFIPYNPLSSIVPLLVEANFAFFLCFGRWATHQSFSPLSAEFQYALPEHVSEYERIFQCSLSFNQPHNILSFSEEVWQMPLVSNNLLLKPLVFQQADQLLAQIDPGGRISDQVTHWLLSTDQIPLFTLEAVAEKLNMSPRSLQRHLTEEGVLFRDLVSDARKRRALNYLKLTKLTVAEIAFLLGFSQVSSFHRSFKRWTGMTVGEWRAS